MARVRDRADARGPGDARGEALRIARGHDAIGASPDEQGRGADPMQALREAAVAEGPELTRRRLEGADLSDLELDLVGPRRRHEELLRERLRPRRERAGQLGGAPRPEVEHRLALVVEAEGRHERETLDARGREGRDLRRERSARPEADEVRAREAGRLEQLLRGDHPVRQVVELAEVAPARMAGQRRHDHTAPRRERLEEGRPAREPEQAGQHAERPAPALLEDADLLAADEHAATSLACGSLRGTRLS